MCDFTYEAFEIADKYRVVVIVLSDAYIGQMMEPVELPTTVKNGKRKDWAIYADRESRKNLITSIFTSQTVLSDLNIRLQEKYKTIEQEMGDFEEVETEDAELVYVAFGITSRLCLTAVQELRRGGVKIGLFRPKTLFPYPSKRLKQLSERVKSFIVAELNNGQMARDVEYYTECASTVLRYNWYGGIVPSTKEIIERTQKDIEAGNVLWKK
jgi:2-oxoisovalerate ferredoxin oxidoreductase alpha subunit